MATPVRLHHRTPSLELLERIARRDGTASHEFQPIEGLDRGDVLSVTYFDGGYVYRIRWSGKGPAEETTRAAAMRMLGFSMQNDEVAS